MTRAASPVVRALTRDLTDLDGVTLTRVTVGERWLMAEVERADGTADAGLANRCGAGGDEVAPWPRRGLDVLPWFGDPDPVRAAVALATLNALQTPDPDSLSDIDGADWLVTVGRGRRVAVIGRFPFLAHEVAPVAATLDVFERDPATGEHGSDVLHRVLPHADVIAITASTVVNSTLDGILDHVPARARLLLLGPSTPLAEGLLDLGFDALAGVRVIDPEQAREDVAAGHRFRDIRGLRRVTLLSAATTP